MNNTLSLRLARMAAGIAHAADTGAYVSPPEAAKLHAELQACFALAREMETRAPSRAPDRFIRVSEAERDMWDRARR